MLTISEEGWLKEIDDRVRIMKAMPRENAKGEMFLPGGSPLARYVRKRYGGPRCAWTHGTDVVPKDIYAMAKRTAYKSKRASGYHFLLGSGLIFQFYSIIVQAWGAGRRRGRVLELVRQGNKKAQAMMDATGKWKGPIIDGRVVGNPNAWGPHIELANWQKLTRVRKDDFGIVRREVRGKMRTVAVLPPGQFTMVTNFGSSGIGLQEPWHNFDPRDLANLEDLLRALYAGPGEIQPDGVLRHSIVGVNRIDPGPLCPIEDIAEAAAHDALELKDLDESNEGDDEDAFQEPWEGPGEHS